MRHKKKLKKLGRPRAHRKALLRNQVLSFFKNGRIKTTLQKAKETRKIAEKLITLAKEDTQVRRRQIFRFLQDKEVIEKLFKEIAPKFKDRNSGYTRIIKLGKRIGDGAEEAVLTFV